MLDPAAPLLRVTDLHVEHVGPQRSSRTVDGVSFDIGAGEIFGLAGESGSGKSTTAKAILRILRPPAIITGGRAELDGVDLFDLDEVALREIRWRDVSLVFQDAMDVLNPVMTIEAQILDVLLAHEDIPLAQARDRAAELLKMVGIDPGRRHGYAHELSGGMRQRVAIAIAMALDPRLVIMDEPTTALDVVLQREILDQLLELQAQRRFSILFITHDLALLLEIATQVGIMYGGRLVEVAAAGDIATSPRHPYTQGLLRSFPSMHGPRRRLRGIGGPALDLRAPPGGCRFHPRCEHAIACCRAEIPELRELETGHRAACHVLSCSSSSKSPAPVLEVRDLSVRFAVGPGRHLRALHRVSLSLQRGKAVALVGESGSGKSTVSKVIARLVAPSEGEVRLAGTDVLKTQRRRASLDYRSRVQMIFQDPFASLNPAHSVHYHLARPLLRHRKADRASVDAAVIALLHEVGLDPPELYAAKYPPELSGGQRQRVAIARALAVQPQVVLADEPTSMLDVSIRMEILNLLRALLTDRGVAMLLVTHDIASARYVADEIAVMYAGEIVEQGPAEAIVEDPQHPYTRLLVGSVPDRARPRTELQVRGGARPDLTQPSPGCSFATRCPLARDVCRHTPAPVRDVGRHHVSRCHLATSSIDTEEPIAS